MCEEDKEVYLVKYKGTFRWFKSEKEYWVLDYLKWGKAFKDAGYDIDPDNSEDRFGIDVVNKDTADQYLECMKPFEISKDQLAEDFSAMCPIILNWWDMEELFPVAFIDFDRQHLASFREYGLQLELYVPNGWTAKYEDFRTEYPPELFPPSEKFWIVDGKDMMKE